MECWNGFRDINSKETEEGKMSVQECSKALIKCNETVPCSKNNLGFLFNRIKILFHQIVQC